MRKDILLIILVLLLTLANTVPTCKDNFQIRAGWYTINLQNSNGQLMRLFLLSQVTSASPKSPQFLIPTNAALSDPSVIANFYIQPIRPIQSPKSQYFDMGTDFPNWTVMNQKVDINSSSGAALIWFSTPSTSTSSKFMVQNCSDGTYRIYKTFSIRSYLGINPT
jgi:hypothetical protein